MKDIIARILDALAALFTKATSALPAPDASPFPFTSEQMERAVVAASYGKAPDPVKIAAALRAACVRYGSKNYRALLPHVISDIISECAHESNGFRSTREIWGPTPAQLRYENRPEMGNTEPGDGRKFSGMFWVQLTWGVNHRAYADKRGISVDVLHASQNDYYTNADVSVWYFVEYRPKFAEASERGDHLAAAIVLNGRNRDGLPNGWEDRQKRRARTRAALELRP